MCSTCGPRDDTNDKMKTNQEILLLDSSMFPKLKMCMSSFIFSQKRGPKVIQEILKQCFTSQKPCASVRVAHTGFNISITLLHSDISCHVDTSYQLIKLRDLNSPVKRPTYLRHLLHFIMQN